MRSDQEVNRLLRANESLVQSGVNRYLKRYYAPGMEREDLVSLGMIGLVHAARVWDPQRSRSFATLACKVIEQTIVRGVMREAKPRQAARTVSLDTPIGAEGEPTFLDQIAGDQDVEGEVLDDAARAAVRTAVAKLPERQRRLIELRFYQDVPAAEAAAALGVSRQGACERQRIALRKLRMALSDTLAAGAC
jgi:RNA polymerase sigma factor (sigma-70 family)